MTRRAMPSCARCPHQNGGVLPSDGPSAPQMYAIRYRVMIWHVQGLQVFLRGWGGHGLSVFGSIAKPQIWRTYEIERPETGALQSALTGRLQKSYPVELDWKECEKSTHHLCICRQPGETMLWVWV